MRLISFAVLSSIPATLLAALAPVELRTEWLDRPLAVEHPAPRLSWRLDATNPKIRAQHQSAFRILAASSAERLAKDDADLWDSGKIENADTLNIEYAGKPLATGQRVFWKVRVWDQDGGEGEWSAAGEWAMGVLKPEDWKAQWITFKDESPVWSDRQKLQLPPARHYRKKFAAAKVVKRAVLYGSALGIVDFHLNGQRVSDDYFAPGWADYRERAHYRALDVTKLITRGGNAIGAIVADGWYAGYLGYGLLVGYGPEKSGRNFYGKTPALLAQLDIEYADGTRDIVATDTTWQTSGDGPHREADLIMGESYDASREASHWCMDGGKSSADSAWKWSAALAAEGSASVKATFHDTLGAREVELGFQKPKRLAAYAAQPIRITQELKATRVTEQKPGVFIFDFGQNFAGNVRLKIKGDAGAKITLRYGEMLHPDGRLMTENLRRARATDTYTLRGGAEETWTPRFTYHGFQFVEVTGFPGTPDAAALTGLVIHNDTPLTGDFACSDDTMTRFWKNTQWTQRANFLEIPTDCPQRDERLGWMGDAQIYARTATYNADTAAFFTKWIDDIREAQRPDGAYPDYAPYPMAHGAPGAAHGTAWTDAGIIVPWTMWQVYADRRLIQRHWASMERFIMWRVKNDPEARGVSNGNTWGDWLNVNEETPIQYIDLCYHAFSTQCMIEMARGIGRDDDVEKYAEHMDTLRAGFARHWITRGPDAKTPPNTPRIDTQTACILALSAGLLDEAQTAATTARLVAKIEANGHRMATGFLGTKLILGVLTRAGHHDLACRLFQSRKFPSWGYEVQQGATTVWERWDSFTKEHGFDGAAGKNNAAMNSFSHYAFGAVMQWGFQRLAGIDTLRPGFQNVLIRPFIPSANSNPDGQPLDWVRATYAHPRGTIASAWRREKGVLHFDITLPANTGGLVMLPVPEGAVLTESGLPLDKANGLRPAGTADGITSIEIGSGEYHFAVRAK